MFIYLVPEPKCVHTIKSSDLAETPVDINGTVITLTPEGTIHYRFSEPTKLKKVVIQTLTVETLVVVPFDEEGKELTAVPLVTDADEPTVTNVVTEGVSELVIRKEPTGRIRQDDVSSLLVVVCKHGMQKLGLKLIVLFLGVSKL